MKTSKVVIEIECGVFPVIDEVITEVDGLLGKHSKLDKVRFYVDGKQLTRVHLFAMRGGMGYQTILSEEADIRFRSGAGSLLGEVK